MNTNWLKARQTKYAGYLTLYIVIILAVLGAVNFLANRYNKSYDSTSNKRYSLSDQTKKVVKGLKDDATITLYDQTSRFAQARDLLDRYENLSTKLSVKYIDPDTKPQLARAAGVTSYGTIYVEVNGKREEAKSVTEEQITNALIRALKGGERLVCAVQGSGEHSLEETGREGYSTLKEVLEKNNYKTKTISLLEKPEVPSACSVLLVGGPRFDYVGPVVEAIKKYVSGGGSALIMLDAPVRFGEMNIAPNKEMVQLLESWGAKMDNNLVLDTSGIGRLFQLGPEVPLVTNYETHPIVRDMRDIATAFPLSRTVETTTADGVTAEKLFSTTSNSYATTDLASEEIQLDPKKDRKGPFNLAVASTITIKAANDSGDKKADDKSKKSGDKPEKKQARLVAVGSSGWVANNTLRFNGNRDLVLNMMNWLTSDEDLISIRPKEPQDRRLTLNQHQMRLVFYSSVIFLPVLIILAGIGIWWRRR